MRKKFYCIYSISAKSMNIINSKKYATNSIAYLIESMIYILLAEIL